MGECHGLRTRIIVGQRLCTQTRRHCVFDWDLSGDADHVGIVKKVEENKSLYNRG